jgi:hypothetical protein
MGCDISCASFYEKTICENFYRKNPYCENPENLVNERTCTNSALYDNRNA